MKLIILATLLGLCMAWPPLPPHNPSEKKASPVEKSPTKKTPTDKEPPESYNEWLGILPHEFISLEKRRSEALRKWQTTQMGKNPFLDPYYEELLEKKKKEEQEQLQKQEELQKKTEDEGAEQKGKAAQDGPKVPQTLEEKEKEFKEKREEARTKLEKKISEEKKKPIEDRKEDYEASKDGRFDEWLAKSKAVEMGARKLYEESKAKVDAITVPESKEKFEKILEKIQKKVEEITNDIKELEKTEEKESSQAIEKALGYFLGHFQTRALIKSDVSELILDIAKEQEDGDEVIKTLEQFLVALERSPLA
ncbi:signal peptide-containing protein [Theileria equi strain WA]|uniref:Signal peptide-containing protein n=1 Tax=Theileria equi strain WA TaxID=1537102 RepID=L0AX61_THEEQ|nr:signal peptide-containing protein [Theileria equi strain WA]AFZ80150.1 signal peptide-containing protein [Theileria equi strain WA]|eukprot:XP_004829816.1 signal peptide-containing protein [Theileria equi strain WA]